MKLPSLLQLLVLPLLLAVPTLSQAQLSDGLLNYWDFEGDFEDDASDFPGSASTVEDDGTNPGGNVVITADGPLGNFGAFARDYVEVADSADVVAAGESLSISAWFRVDGFDQNWQALIAHGESSDYRIARRGGANVLGYAGGTTDIPNGGAVGPDVNDGAWHHVVAMTEAGVMTSLYVDGSKVTDSVADGRAAPNLTDNGAGQLMIGGNPNTGGDAAGAFRAWNGGLDDIGMWDRILTEAEITQIYTEGQAGTSLAVLINPGDNDNDGLPNAWEVANDLDPDSAEGDDGAFGDPDMDNVNNTDELDNDTDPQDADTDDDFSNDGEEEARGTDPLDPDSDDDGLLDGHETDNGANSYVSPTDTGTDPLEPDTDGDGTGDAVEIVNNTDPTDAGSVPPPSSLPIVDDFEDELINAVDWTIIAGTVSQNADGTVFGGTVDESGGTLNLGSRGYLHTTEEFDPATVGAINITGEWVFNSGDDFLQILTRSDALPALAWGETNSGVEFFANAGNEGVTIRSRNPDHTVENVVTSGSIVINAGATYLFSIIDSPAGNLSFVLEEKDSPDNRVGVTADLTAELTDHNFIVFHNRENRNSSINEVSIDVIADSDGDGMDDEWEEANGLIVGVDDSGLDPDMDDSTNLEEHLAFTDPQDDDTDDDGALDGSETNTGVFVSTSDRGTDPLGPDTDGDGALDGAEDNTGVLAAPDSIGSDPHNPDSDGDGMSDGVEVEVGRDPNNPGDAPTGLGQRLLAYWDFDGTLDDVAHGLPSDSTVADDGTFTGPDTDVGFAESGLFGSSALEQNGEAGWVTVARSADTLRGTDNAVSISAWCKVAAFDGQWQCLISHGEGSQYRIARRANEGTLAYAGGSGDIPAAGIGPAVDDGGWHHVAAISEDGISTQLWIDGVLVETGGAPTINDQGNSNPIDADLFIGNNPQALGREWEGCIDDVAIWGRALTEEEIASIYAGGDGASIAELLGFGGGPGLQITEISYDPDGGLGGNGEFSLTWPSQEGTTYGVYYSLDLEEWDSDLDDSYMADPGETTTFTFDHPEPGVSKIFFRVIEN